MIIVRTPLRVSLFGGGTDLPAWYRENGGAVLGFALNRYVWHTLRVLPPFFAHKHRITWSEIELVNDPGLIHHPAARALLQDWQGPGLELHCDVDLPARSGLGSSSAFTVGLINALQALQGQRIDARTLATEAIHVEQDIIREAVGSQDQIWAATGGFNRIDFDSTCFCVRPIVLPQLQLENFLNHLLLVFVGFPRAAAKIEADKIERLSASVETMRRIQAQVDEAETLLDDPKTLGYLLGDAWQAKRALSPLVATSAVDAIYATALAAGAYGGKLLGAGGGGFMLFIVAPDRRNQVKSAIGNLIEVPVAIDRAGSTVVLYEPNGLI